MVEKYKQKQKGRNGWQEARNIRDSLIEKITEEAGIDLLEDTYRVLHFEEVIEYCIRTNKDGVRLEEGHPVVNENGERLAFQNVKSGNNTFHFASHNSPSESAHGKRALKLRTWSVCNGGASGKDQHIYISKDEFKNIKESSDGYIIRNGDILGKLCGNCIQSVNF